jgi:hypothetical protein
MPLQLPNVTLIALTSLDYEGHRAALDRSKEGVEWGAVKLIWDESIRDINDWNKKIIYDLHRYVDTDFAMLIHADGYVTNPDAWDDEFLAYDYVGAPWPLPTDDYSYRDERGNLVRVGNSVSLRSTKLMRAVATRPWRSYYGNTNEDGFITCHNRVWLEEQGCRFAPLELAARFSKEHEIPENQGVETFAFHTIG